MHLLHIIYYFFVLLKDIEKTSFLANFIQGILDLFFLEEKYKLKNLLVKVEKITLTFLSLAFFNPE